MKRLLNTLIILNFSTTLFCSYSFAEPGAEWFPGKSFEELNRAVNSLENLSQTLVVMDDDDTLTMMNCPKPKDQKTCQYIGGPAWYSWQEDLLLNKGSRYRVATDTQDLLEISALLLSMNYSKYVEETIPDILSLLTESGVKLLVLTARGSSNISATENQFENISVTDKKYENFLDLIKQNALNGKNSQIASIAGPFLPKNKEKGCIESKTNRQVSYQQGVMYVAGQNKGVMLKCLLSRTKSTGIKNIVFIDDTKKNVTDVYAAFEDSKKYTVKAIHYTQLKEHKSALTEGKNSQLYQEKAQKRWREIKRTLRTELLAPALPKT